MKTLEHTNRDYACGSESALFPLDLSCNFALANGIRRKWWTSPAKMVHSGAMMHVLHDRLGGQIALQHLHLFSSHRIAVDLLFSNDHRLFRTAFWAWDPENSSSSFVGLEGTVWSYQSIKKNACTGAHMQRSCQKVSSMATSDKRARVDLMFLGNRMSLHRPASATYNPRNIL